MQVWNRVRQLLGGSTVTADVVEPTAKGYLTLGWTVTKALEAKYWQQPGATPGGQSAEDLFLVPAADMAYHTAIIAQSGSGKSFFLGRLIEEILINSKARCIVFDPNADFRRVSEVKDSIWMSVERDRGAYTHEKTGDGFREAWKRVGISVRSGRARALQPGKPRRRQVPLELWWPSIPLSLLVQDLDPVHRDEMDYCHKTLEALGFLLEYKSIDHSGPFNLIDEAERLFARARESTSTDALEAYIDAEYGFKGVTGHACQEGQSPLVTFDKDEEASISAETLKAKADDLVKRAEGLKTAVSEGVQQRYFQKARALRYSGILQDVARNPDERWRDDVRLEVIDLPSLDEATRTQAVFAILDREWSRAKSAWETAMLPFHEKEDRRVPTFVIVDEAHNLLPASPRGKMEGALGDMFRKVAAEGRKFGLFLMVVSQRPEKLDPLIFSECENKAIMKIASSELLDSLRSVMGIDSAYKDLLHRCTQFKTGRALMIGRWSSTGGKIIYGAARRTYPGGGNLNAAYWASPPEYS